MIQFIAKASALGVVLLMTIGCSAIAFAKTAESDLFEAARNNDLPRVKVLLAAKVDVNANTAFGATALFIASKKNGHLEIVRELIDAKADLNVPYQGTLRPTTTERIIGILLISAAILFDLYIIWRIGKKVLRIARWSRASGQVVRQLETHNDEVYTLYTPIIAFVDQRGVSYECQPSHAFPDTNRYPLGRQVKVAYDPENPNEADVDPTWDRYFGHGVLLFAVTVFPLLFGYAMVFGSVDAEGYTALRVASRYGHGDIVQLLEKAGASRVTD